MSGLNTNSGFNFSINSTPLSNNLSKINSAATSTPFGFGSSASTPATNLFGSLKSGSNTSFTAISTTPKNELNTTKTEANTQKTQESTSTNTISNTLTGGSNTFNLGINSKSNDLPSNTENKQKRGFGFEASSSNDQSNTASSDPKKNINQSISSAGTLPNVLSFNVPSLSSPVQEPKSTISETKTFGLGGTCNTRVNQSSTSQANKSFSSQSKPTAIKDQQLPQILMDCIDEFKKNLEEMRKVKELNSTFSSKIIHQNIQEILTLKQNITQSQTEFQRNVNEVAKLKENITQELRNVDICEHLKDMPLGFQYDCDIWNEYFMSRVRLFQNKLRILKNQFEQLEGYFRVHDRENIFESQRIVETLKASHKNLLNEAAMLKTVHEKVDELKSNFLLYRKNVVGDPSDIFENNRNSNISVNLNNSTFKI